MRRTSAVWALILIALGLFLLLREVFPEWEGVSIGSVVLIALGAWLLIDRPMMGGGWRGGIVVPLVLLAIGVTLLLRDLDVIRGDISLGPIVLIAIGLGILMAALSTGTAPPATVRSISLEGARSAGVSIRHGAGRLILGPLSDPELLLDGTFTGDVDARTRRDGDRLDVSLRQRRAGGWWGRGWRGFEWAVSLNRNVPVSLEVKTGGSAARIELEELLVPEVIVETGASQVEMSLPVRGHTSARLRAGAAQVRVRFPPGVAGRIRSRTGLATTNVDGTRFPRVGDVFQSSDYETAENRVDLDVEAGAADVSVS